MSDKDDLINALIAGEPTKWTRIKNKIAEHKNEIGIGLICLVAGVILGRQIGKKTAGELETPVIEGDVSFLTTAVSCYKPTINNIDHSTTIINEEPATRLSYIVKVGDDIYETQREAAEALGVSESHLSSYLNGKKDYINGETPIRLGVRTA